MARKIALDHLKEDPRYYDKLAVIESAYVHRDGKKLLSRVLVEDHAGNVLAVLHDDDPTRIGLPGGHVEPGEDPRDTAVRELHEETGLKALRLFPYAIVDEPRKRSIIWSADAVGNVRSSFEGRTVWVRPSSLLTGRHRAFYEQIFRRGVQR